MSFFQREFWWEPIVVIAFLLALAWVIAATYRRWSADLDGVPVHIRAGVLVATAIAFLLRRFAVAPAFLHDGFIGPGIAANALSFPPDPTASWHYGREYGLGGFTVLSLYAAVFGRTMETVLAANTVFSALTTIPLALLAAFWAQTPSAGLYAAAIWATSPFVARLAHSEEIHVLGMLWALVALVLLEVALARRSRFPLIGVVLAMALAVMTRQTFYPCIAIAGALFVERWLRAGRPRRVFTDGPRLWWLAAAFACVPIWLRAYYAVNTWEFEDVVTVHRLMLAHPELIWGTLVDHPILALRTVSFTVPLLGLVGVFVIARRSLSPVTILIAVVGWFVVWFPTYPNLGSDWPFRFHFYTSAILVAGAGTAWLVETFAARTQRRLEPRTELAAAVAVGILGLCATATLANRKPNPEFVEYVFMREALSHVDRPFSVVGAGATGIQSRIMDLWAEGENVPVVTPIDPLEVLAGQPRPFIFLYGLGCHTYNILNLMEIQGTGGGERPSEETMTRFHRLARDRSMRFGMDAGSIPAQMRPVCAEVLAHSTTLAEGPEIELKDDPPWSIFNVDRLRPRLVRWDPPAVH